MLNHKICCIVPVYNVLPYLPELTRSFDEQTCDDFDVIIIDDGSTDGSGVYMDEWAADKDYVYVFHTNNQGLGAARNNGMKYAKDLGVMDESYFFFIDSDDEITTDAIEVLVREIQKESCDVIEYEVENLIEQEDGSYIRGLLSPNDYVACNNPVVGTVSGFEYLSYIFEQGISVRDAVWFRIYRVDFIFTNHIDFIAGIVPEDVFYTFLVFVHANSIRHIKNCLYLYRKRTGSLGYENDSLINARGRSVTIINILRYLDSKMHYPLSLEQINSVEKYMLYVINVNYNTTFQNSNITQKDINEMLGEFSPFENWFLRISREPEHVCGVYSNDLEGVKQRLVELNEKLNVVNTEFDDLYNSHTYKVGRLIMRLFDLNSRK